MAPAPAWPLLVLLAAAALACGGAHRALRARPLPAVPAAQTWTGLPALRLLSLGYRQLLADGYWLRAVGAFGDRQQHARNYPDLAPLVARAVELDPDFIAPYVFAGTAMTLAGMDPRPALALLDAGVARHGDDWRLPFLLGFNAYYLLGDYGRAARAMGRAARNPAAPAHLGPLADRLAVAAGEPSVGLALMQTALAGTAEPRLQQAYAARRDLLLLEVRLQALQQAVDGYRAAHGHPPADLAALPVAAGSRIDPLGGLYWLGPGGRVQTLHEPARLHLSAAASRGAPLGPWR